MPRSRLERLDSEAPAPSAPLTGRLGVPACAGGEIGIYDATNSTRERRAAVQARAAAAAERAGHSVSVVFIESVCDEEALLEANMVAKVRASPDFKDLSEAAALADLRDSWLITPPSALQRGGLPWPPERATVRRPR